MYKLAHFAAQQNANAMEQKLKEYFLFETFCTEYQHQHKEDQVEDFETRQWQDLYLQFVQFETSKTQNGIPVATELKDRVKSFVVFQAAEESDFFERVEQAKSPQVKRSPSPPVTPIRKRKRSVATTVQDEKAEDEEDEQQSKKSKWCIPTIRIQGKEYAVNKYVECKKFLRKTPFLPISCLLVNEQTIRDFASRIDDSETIKEQLVKPPLLLCPVEDNAHYFRASAVFECVLACSRESAVDDDDDDETATVNNGDESSSSDSDTNNTSKHLIGITIGKTLYVRGIDVSIAKGFKKKYFYTLSKKIPSQHKLHVQGPQLKVLHAAINAQHAGKYFGGKIALRSVVLCTFASAQKLDSALTCTSRVKVAKL